MKKIKLGDLCVPSAGQLKKDSDELIDYIDISSVDNETKKVTGYQTLLFEEAPSRARKTVKKGSILVSTVRPNLNAVAMLEEDTPNISVASTGFCVLDSKENVDNRFILNFCKSKTFINAMVAQATGASYPAVSDKIVRAALVPDYTYEEQCNISEVLDKVSNVIEKRKAELCSLDDLIKARFVEMFGNPEANEKEWKMNTFGDICTVRQGLQIPISKRLTQYEDDCYEYITVQYLHGGKEREYIKSPKTSVICTQNDILMTRTGNTGMVVTGVDGVFHNNFFLIDFDRNKYDKDFLVQYLKLDIIQADILRRAGTSTIPDLNHSDFYKIKIFEPPIELQKQFTELITQVDKSKSAVKKALDETQLLFDSLMQEYFG